MWYVTTPSETLQIMQVVTYIEKTIYFNIIVFCFSFFFALQWTQGFTQTSKNVLKLDKDFYFLVIRKNSVSTGILK